MHKWKIRLFILLVTIGLLIPAAVLVLKNEYDKKIARAAADVEYFKSMEADYERYRQEQLEQIQRAIEENKKSMNEAKLSYESLLAQQPAIIDQHKRQVPITEQVPTQKLVSSSKASSSSSSSSTKTTSKPKTTKQTKTS